MNLNLIGPDVHQDKKEVRNQVRLLPDGEITWQKLQAFVYSKGITQARLIKGVEGFFKACAKAEINVYIVSHKTEYSPYDTDSINLRQAALEWMTANRFFEADGLGLARTQVYFESTRVEKIERLKFLGCTHFIDDLKEVFIEKTFPQEVEKILFEPRLESASTGHMKVFKSWERIHEYFFGG